jgi:hypothetical protein
MIRLLIVATVLGLTAYVLWWGFRRRVIFRNAERPNLVVMQAKWCKVLLLAAVGMCTICGWKSRECWTDPAYIEKWLLPDLKAHRCPTLDEASAPPEWERTP